jgi:hypothetical protein
MKQWRVTALSRRAKLCVAIVVCFIVRGMHAVAQDGVQGIEDANDMVREYFDVGINLMYAIGAVLGLIGGVRVYQRWSAGDPNTGQTAASWFGSCIFLVIVATVLRSFFGL